MQGTTQAHQEGTYKGFFFFDYERTRIKTMTMRRAVRYSVAIQSHDAERWGAGVETQKNVRGVFGGWGRVPFNEPYAPSLSTIYDGA